MSVTMPAKMISEMPLPIPRSVICVLPSLLHEKMKVPFYFGGTGLMIVVGVALDTVQQIESHLITRNYEGFTGPRGPRIRGRGGRGTGAVGS